VQETTVAKAPQLAKQKRPTPEHMKIEGKARLMRIYVGESDRWQDKPLHEALVHAMRANDIAGVTVYRGLLGYGAHRRANKEKPAHLSKDASIMLSVVDTEDKLQAFLPVVDQMVQEGLVVMSDVNIVKYSWRPAELETEVSAQ
jgi:PII-like signaling protein